MDAPGPEHYQGLLSSNPLIFCTFGEDFPGNEQTEEKF